jgi:hypothetical protein
MAYWQGVLFFHYFDIRNFGEIFPGKKKPIAHSMANIPIGELFLKKKKKNFCSVKIF